MKIAPLILVDTQIVGGPGRGIFQLARHLAQEGNDFALANFHYTRPRSKEFLAEASRLNIPVTSLPQRFRGDWRSVGSAINLMRERGLTLIQSHGYKSHLVAALVASHLGIPWVAFTHGWTAEDLKVRLYHRLDLFLLRRADVVIGVSEEIRERFASLRRGAPTILIENAVDPDILPSSGKSSPTRRREVRATLGVSDREILGGCIGRLSHEKGQDVLVEAVATCKRSLAEMKIVMMGDGPLRDSIAREIAERDLRQEISMVPHQTAIRDYLEALDVLILPSRSEGLPNIVLEAMACRVPVIATTVGAVPQLVSDRETGWLVPPEDPGALGAAITHAHRKRAELAAMGRRARVSIMHRFSPRIRGERIMEVYRSVLAQQETAVTQACPQ